MKKQIQFSVKSFAVDPSSGELRNVGLITAGREAKGHGIHIDAKTLETALASVQEKGGRLKGYVGHSDMGKERITEIPGYFEDIRIEGDKLIAGKFTWFDSFARDEPAAHGRLVEMASKTPDLFGLSIEAWGYGVYVDANGDETSEPNPDMQYQYDGMPAFRVTDLSAVAFVAEPAANDGLAASSGLGRELVALAAKKGDTGPGGDELAKLRSEAIEFRLTKALAEIQVDDVPAGVKEAMTDLCREPAQVAKLQRILSWATSGHHVSLNLGNGHGASSGLNLTAKCHAARVMGIK